MFVNDFIPAHSHVKSHVKSILFRSFEVCHLRRERWDDQEDAIDIFVSDKQTLCSIPTIITYYIVKRQTSQADLTRVSLLGSLLIAQSLNKIDDAPIPPSWNSFEKCSSFVPGSKIWPSLRSPIKLRVLKIVKDYAKKDLAIFSKALCARNLVNQVDRKLMKQTVTTSVDDDTELFHASCYAAKKLLHNHPGRSNCWQARGRGVCNRLESSNESHGTGP
ncbi:hypothetical protein POM88_000595 [Heracleum sosnowskyi]|uniref:Uncharacterized protein n=1 Tax=Heracleum sosnowskyi TaxID=360622 RepID=A0AAD8JEK5_9APIA|nr:hypothetical protein POM88_000595 [Heracleum sosnowskyi]